MNNSTVSTSPCAACKMDRKKCPEKCILAPYFPLEDLHKFQLVHRVFGKAHVIKLLRDLPAEQRGDAVSSIVYEAGERERDPVHGSLGVVNHLRKKVAELQSKLASTEAEVANISVQYDHLLSLYQEVSGAHFHCASPHVLDDDVDPLQLWEPLWT